MSERSAQIRLMLNSGGLLSGLTQVGDKVQALGARMKSSLSGAMSNATSAMGASLHKLQHQTTEVSRFAIGLGGAFSLEEAAKDALSLDGKFKNLAFAIKAGTGEAVKWQEIQERTEWVATQWKQHNADVAHSFRDIYEETGSLHFTEKAIGSVAKASLATGKDMGIFADLAGQAYEKFGIGADEMDTALAAIVSFGERGGLTIEEMAAKMGMLGASAKVAGAGGVEGLSRILGMSQVGKEALGNMRQRITAVTGLLDELSDPSKAKNIGKALHVNLLDKKGNVKADALDTILAKTGGDTQKLMPLFSGPAAKLMVEFGKYFQEGRKELADEGEKNKQKLDAAGIEAFHSDLKKLSTSNLTAADLEEQATKKTQTAKAAMVDAMNELENAFAKPEAINAMKSLAHVAPKVATGMAKILELGVEHPVAAAATYVAGKAGIAGLQSLLGSLASGGFHMAKGGISSFYSPALGRTRSVEQGVFDSMGMRTGSRTVQVGTSKLAAAGQIAGQAMGVALVAYAAYELGKVALDAMLEGNEKAKKSNEQDAAVGMAVSGGTDRKAQEEALAKLKKQRDQQEKEVKEGPGVFDTIMTYGAKGLNKAGMLSDDDVRSVEGRSKKDLAYTNESIGELEKSLGLAATGGTEAWKSMTQMADAATKAKEALLKMVPQAPGSHGVPVRASGAPGHSPS